MTVSSTTRTAGPFVGTGLVSTYSFSFYVFQNTDLLLQVTDTNNNIRELVYGSDYTVTLNANQSTSPGGTITLTTPLASGYTLVMTSQVEAVQSVDILNPSNFNPNVVTKALDYLTVLLQQQDTQFGYAIRAPIGDLSNVELPAPGARSSQILGFDSGGNVALYGPGAVNMNIVSQPQSETQTLAAGQSVVTLATFTYPSSKPNAIFVFIDGEKITDFTQTSDTSITLTSVSAFAHTITLTTNAFSSFSSGKTAATDYATTGTDGASYQFHRQASYVGGTPGYVNACLYATTTVGAGATSFEWTGLFVMNNYASTGNGNNVALYAQGNKYTPAPTWAATFELIDWAGADPISSSVAVEVDMSANGTDANLSRVGIDLVYRREGHVGASMECAFGLRFNSDDPDLTQALLKTAIGFTSGAHVGIGIDFSAATIFGAAAKLGYSQVFQWGNGIGAAARQLTYTGTALVMQDASGVNPPLWQLNDNGTLLVNGKQLLSANAQQTGWVALTGTPDHTSTWAISTVTLPQLAARVGAIEQLLLQQGQAHV